MAQLFFSLIITGVVYLGVITLVSLIQKRFSPLLFDVNVIEKNQDHTISARLLGLVSIMLFGISWYMADTPESNTRLRESLFHLFPFFILLLLASVLTILHQVFFSSIPTLTLLSQEMILMSIHVFLVSMLPLAPTPMHHLVRIWWPNFSPTSEFSMMIFVIIIWIVQLMSGSFIVAQTLRNITELCFIGLHGII